MTRVDKLLALPDIEGAMDRVAAKLDAALERGNAALARPAARVVHGGGKRLRPILVLASAAAGGGKIDDGVLAAAAAVELVHVGSLVHDDIIDHAPLRRGVPTINATEGVDHAVLVGDFLLSSAGGLAASVNREVAADLAEAITELCIGQSLETSMVQDPDRRVDDYLRSIDGKTAALMRQCCRIGGHAAALDESVVQMLADFGTAFGMAFQIIDDVLDIASTSEKLGKPVGNDVMEGVYTLPVLLLLEREPDLKTRLGPTATDDDRAAVLDAVRGSDVVDEALSTARRYSEAAVAALRAMPENNTVRGLAQLPLVYLDDTLANL